MNLPEQYWYLHTARAGDLTGRDYYLYRFFEMLPAILSVGTLGLFIVLSFYKPVWAAYLTIVFAAYWFFKTAYLSIHLRHDFKRVRHNLQVNWRERVLDVPHLPARAGSHLLHLVLVPFYDEQYELLKETVDAIAASEWDTKRIAIVFAAEARVPQGKGIGERLAAEYADRFFAAIVTEHPDGLEGEIPGKGSNLSYAAEEARTRILDAHQVPYEHVVVSAFDSDTVVYPQYFACLTWYVLTAERPERTSFQPVPLYNNNIWDAPMLSRVMAYSASFWQMIQQERPEKLATFSSHAVLFKPLYEAGYWQKNMVSEDSRIFWNLFVYFDGDYRVTPMAYPVSMDANVATTFWGTIKNIYKQQRRWTYGTAENAAYILFTFLKNPRIPSGKKIHAVFFQLEGAWSLATHPLVLFAIGWLPLFVGGAAFHTTVLSYSLPFIARAFLTAAMFGLIVSAAICMYLIPDRPAHASRHRSIFMVLQWILVPFTMVVFSSIPGLESQLRLAVGRYLGFWVTPKNRTQ
ncbi:MAG TPA: glycosyltransferase family 2 protein [Candidatus Paceibacterota bacterium]|nr:glycosyltransferase family 2 protein [Candidatus Paceibacterota bacterium]